MKSAKNSELSAANIDIAVEALKSGGVVAFPTDTFYALGVDACNPGAILRAFRVKRRDKGFPMPVLIAGVEQATDLVSDFHGDAKWLAERFWPGALTIVLPASERVPFELNGGSGTVGVRVPDNDVALRLISQFGAGVTGTSANRSGEPPTKSAAELISALNDEIDVAVDGPCGDQTAPSTVIDCTGAAPRILRAGAISAQELGIALETCEA